MSKYNNKKTIVDNIKFDSKAEANRYIELKMLEKAGKISNLELQPKFILQEKYINNKGEKVRAITYKADFSYIEKTEILNCRVNKDRLQNVLEQIVVEDVKGVETKEFKLKKKLLEYKYQDIDFRLVK